jgi:hypothetical protein
MFDFTISPDEGDPYQVTATTRDIAKWEKTTKGASLRQLETEYRATDLYAIAYHAAIRTGMFAGTLKEFQDGADLRMLDDGEDEDEDPTQPAA